MFALVFTLLSDTLRPILAAGLLAGDSAMAFPLGTGGCAYRAVFGQVARSACSSLARMSDRQHLPRNRRTGLRPLRAGLRLRSLRHPCLRLRRTAALTAAPGRPCSHLLEVAAALSAPVQLKQAARIDVGQPPHGDDRQPPRRRC